ncbi:hypothetical protein, partial [Staphylococcus aureus]|uniref:hypothetical protein n=1 Tax=Staphylococcus aureus TaxID=1280 RepID=UPI0018A1B903
RQSFQDAFQPTLSELKAGFGFDGPFLKARDEVRQLEERIDTFIDDTKYAFGESTAALQQAPQASVEYALTTLSGSEGLSDVGNALQELHGRAASLAPVLVKLGVSASDAASAVQDALVAGIDRLRNSFVEDLQADINSASDKGYLNS